MNHKFKELFSRSIAGNHLEKMLVDYMGLSYDQYNQRHFEELQNICDKLIEICKNQK